MAALAFFTVAFLTTHIPLLLLTTDQQMAREKVLLISLTIGFLVMLLEGIAWRGLDMTVSQSKDALTSRALESDYFAARFVADQFALDVDKRWRILEQELGDTPSLRYFAVGRSSGEGTDRSRLAAIWSSAATSRIHAVIQNLTIDAAARPLSPAHIRRVENFDPHSGV